jgi:hypothetical protein
MLTGFKIITLMTIWNLIMYTVSVAEAKARLSELLNQVKVGEEIVITRRGRPVARRRHTVKLETDTVG